MSSNRVLIVCDAPRSRVEPFISQIRETSHSEEIPLEIDTLDAPEVRHIDEIHDRLQVSTKVIFLWTKSAGREMSTGKDTGGGSETSGSESASWFLCAVEAAHQQEEEASRDLVIVHVELQEGCIPDDWRRTDVLIIRAGFAMADVLRTLQEGRLVPYSGMECGLAWTFGIGYLMRILPDFPACIAVAMQQCSNLSPCLLVVVPRSCVTLPRVAGCDVTDRAVERRMHVAGTISRSYKTNLYAVTDKEHDGEMYYGAVEYATPVRALHKMSLFAAPESQHEWLRGRAASFSQILDDVMEQLLLSNSSLRLVDVDDSEFEHLDLQSYSEDERVHDCFRKCILAAIKDTIHAQIGD